MIISVFLLILGCGGADRSVVKPFIQTEVPLDPLLLIPHEDQIPLEDYKRELWEAYENNDVAALKQVLLKYKNSNVEHLIDKTLIDASENGYHTIVSELLAAGADVNFNSVENYGKTPLIAAAAASIYFKEGMTQELKDRYLSVVKQLIAAGADVNRVNDHGETALMVAAKVKHKIIGALLEAGADIRFFNEYGNSALMLASQTSNFLKYFMREYAKTVFDLPDNTSEKDLVNAAFCLLIALSNDDIAINKQSNYYDMVAKKIGQFLSDPLIDLSAVVTHNVPNVECEIKNQQTQTKEIVIQDVELKMNSMEMIYKHLLVDIFDAIYKSSKKKRMLDIINRWDIETKRKMLIAIFSKRNADKLKAILTNTIEQDPKANEKRKALKEMVRSLLVDEVYISKFKELQIVKELIYKIFEDEIHPDNLDENIIIDLHNKGWR